MEMPWKYNYIKTNGNRNEQTWVMYLQILSVVYFKKHETQMGEVWVQGEQS